ncbi:MAG TPA: hypothetical protein VJS12_02910, partial [Steroidobacteraceae bacterium]|nr:hypothetical protein [Steroidobacteraceae bacterium]
MGLLLSTASPAQLPRFDIVSILESCDQDALLEMTGVIFRAKDTEPLLQEVAREWIGKNSKSGRASACARPKQQGCSKKLRRLRFWRRLREFPTFGSRSATIDHDRRRGAFSRRA